MAKRHNCTTGKTVDREIEKATLAEIEGCQLMCDESVYHMDKRLAKTFGKSATTSNVAPDKKVLDQFDADQGDLDLDCPPASVMRPDR